MKNKFMLGAISGMSALAIAFPVAARIASAQSANGTDVSADSSFFSRTRAPLSREDVLSLADRDTAFLAHIDAFVALQKSATQSHKDALTAAAAITDETERQEAVRAANGAFHTSMKEAMDANADFKLLMPFGGKGHGMGMRGFLHGNPAAKLGMTEAELKTELDSGKTIEQIAEEKGIDLPARPFKGMMRGMMNGNGSFTR